MEKYFDVQRSEGEYYGKSSEGGKELLRLHEEFMNMAYNDGYKDGSEQQRRRFEEHREYSNIEITA